MDKHIEETGCYDDKHKEKIEQKNESNNAEIEKDIFLVRDNKLEYFICTFTEDDAERTSYFKNIKAISSCAFKNMKDYLSTVCVADELNTIEKSAFENCDELYCFFCGKVDFGSELKLTDCSIKNISQTENFAGNFTIQSNAFKNCSALTTVIFPTMSNLSKLIIEKDAFSGCENLRTVVAICDDIDFTENPFEDCPADLTFICRKNSQVAKFVRENGYRSINV